LLRIPPLLSVEATGVCNPIGNTEIVLAVVHLSPQRLWSDTNITELLGFRNKSIMAGNLKAKYPVWDSKTSNNLDFKLLELFVCSNFEISAPQCSTHYTPDGRGDVFDIIVLVLQNIQLSEAIGSPTNMFSIPYPVRTREALDPVETLTDWELFQSLVSELIPLNIKFTHLMKLIEENVTLYLLYFQHTEYRLEKLQF
jgi:hypothetical protein